MPELGKTMGILYAVATPIGNLEDITLRALRILKLEKRLQVINIFLDGTRTLLKNGIIKERVHMRRTGNRKLDKAL